MDNIRVRRAAAAAASYKIHELFPSMIDSPDFRVHEFPHFSAVSFTDAKNFRAFCVPLLRTCMSPKFISCEVGRERMTREDIKKTLCQPPVGPDTIRQFLLSRGRIFPTVKSYFRCCAIFSRAPYPPASSSSSLINDVSSDIPFPRLANLIKATELNATMLPSPANR